MAMRTRYGFYKFLVMPFGLCNALSTFTTLINFIFHEKLNEFMIIYIDDILVYSKTTEEHAKHFKYVLGKIQDNQLFANRAKSEFAQEKMNFLNHILSWEGVKANLKKLEAI